MQSFKKNSWLSYNDLAWTELVLCNPEDSAEETDLYFKTISDHSKIKIETLDLDAVIIAGERWMKYLKRKTKAKCPNCGIQLNAKEHFLSDFYIGGFAVARCDAILTRNRGIYKKYFPELQSYDASPKAL